MFDLTLMTLLCWSATGGRDCMRRRVADTTHEPYRVCYYATWAKYRPNNAAMLPSHIDPFLCTHIVMAFTSISSEGRLELYAQDDESTVTSLLQLKMKNPTLKVLAAVGGWNFGSAPFRQVSATKESRKAFVNSTIEFLDKWKFDGLDIHWEYPEWQDSQNFASLIQNLSECFQKVRENSTSERYLLTAAVPATKERMGGYDTETMKKHLDFINVMTYDFNGPWNNKTGHNSPLYSNDGSNLAEGAKLWVDSGIPRPKIVVGLPTYGHTFRLQDPNNHKVGAPTVGGVSGKYTGTPGFFAYYEVCECLKKDDTVVQWDHLSSVPYAYNNDTWVSFDDTKSLQKKVEWILGEQYGGVMVWELSMDDFSGSFCGKGPNDSFPLLKAIFSARSSSHNISFQPSPIYPKITQIGVVEEVGNATEKPCEFNKPVAKDCGHFVTCAHGQIFELACPDGLAFNEMTTECVPASAIPGCFVDVHSTVNGTIVEGIENSTVHWSMNETSIIDDKANFTDIFILHNTTFEPIKSSTHSEILSSSTDAARKIWW